MAYYHYQCANCLCTTYLFDDGVDDGIVKTGAFDDCGCIDETDDEFYDDDDDD